MTEKELDTFLKGLEEILDNAYRFEYAVNKGIITREQAKELVKISWGNFDFKKKVNG